MTRASDRLRRRVEIVPRAVWLLVLLSAAVSVTLSLTVFRHGSFNNDDGAYLLQAELLRHGHLTLQGSPGQLAASQPWFFALHDGAYVGKYLPFIPGIFALGLLLFGSVVPVLALLAALLPILMWRLALRCTLSARRASLAAALVTLAPLAMIQSGLALSYLPFLLLLLIGWEGALAHAYAPHPRLARSLGLGLVATAALCARPLDAVVLLGPVLLWAVVRQRVERPRTVLAFTVGAIPFGVLTLLYNAAVTGSPLRLPFSLLESQDKLGFGERKLYPEDPPHQFGPRESLQGLVHHFLIGGSTWLILLPAAACVFLCRGGDRAPWRRPGVAPILVASGVFLVAYAFFWGPYSASVIWGGTDTVGVFYALPLLPALALVLSAAEPRPGLGTAVLAAVAVLGLILNVAQLARALGRAEDDRRVTARVLDLADASRQRGVLLVDFDIPYLGHPVSGLRNAPGQDASPVLNASVLDPVGLRSVLSGAELLQLPQDPYTVSPFPLSLRKVQALVSPAPSVQVSLAGANGAGANGAGATGTVLVVERAGVSVACAVGAVGQRLQIDDDLVTGCSGAPVPPPPVAHHRCLDSSCVSFTFYRQLPDGGVAEQAWRRVVTARDGADWVVPVDGPVVAQQGAGWIQVVAGS